MAGGFELAAMGHQAGNTNCPACFGHYPLPCTCGGLIHAHMAVYRDENENLHNETHVCDNCAHNYRRQPRTLAGVPGYPALY